MIVVGANILKPFFIAGCATTAMSFSATLLCVRTSKKFPQRQYHQPPPLTQFPTGHNQALIGRVEQLYDRISVVSGITGSAGLVALAVFDTARHHDLHFFCLLVFMGGITFISSALATQITDFHQRCNTLSSLDHL